MGTKEKKNKSEDEKETQAAAQSRELEQPSMSQTKKRHIHTDAGFRRRIIALAVITGILFLVFLIRLVQFQLVDGSKYRTQAERGRPGSTSQSGETVPVPLRPAVKQDPTIFCHKTQNNGCRTADICAII